MSVMFSGDALQCCNLGLRVNRIERNATVFCKRINRVGHFQAKSFVDLQHVDLVEWRLLSCEFVFKASWNLAPFYLRRSGTMICWSRHTRMTRPSSIELSLI